MENNKKFSTENIDIVLSELSKSIENLRPAHEEFLKLIQQQSKLSREKYEIEKRLIRTQLILETNYEEPEYPDIGVIGSNGSANFKDDQQAKDLISILRNDSSYYRSYMLEAWDGPGLYEVVPTCRRDHDGGLIYLATFQKSEEK